MTKIPRGVGPAYPQVVTLMGATGDLAKRKLGFAGAEERYELDTSLFRPPRAPTPQLSLF